MACTFQALTGGKFEPLAGLRDDDIDTMIAIYNTVATDAATASEIFGKCFKKKLWLTRDILDPCDKMRDLKRRCEEGEEAKEYREANKRIRKVLMNAEEDLKGIQCMETETGLNKNDIQRAYQLVKDQRSERQGRSSTMELSLEEKEILSRRSEYCSEPYSYESHGGNT